MRHGSKKEKFFMKIKIYRDQIKVLIKKNIIKVKHWNFCSIEYIDNSIRDRSDSQLFFNDNTFFSWLSCSKIIIRFEYVQKKKYVRNLMSLRLVKCCETILVSNIVLCVYTHAHLLIHYIVKQEKKTTTTQNQILIYSINFYNNSSRIEWEQKDS